MVAGQETGESLRAYAEMAGRVAVWQWVARDLLAAANVLHQHRRGSAPRRRKGRSDSPVDRSSAPILLLYGMALEDLLKGLLIAQGTPATVGGKLNRALKTHDVLALWRKAGVTVDDERAAVLSALAWAIEIGGRYPVGLHPSPSNMRHLRVGISPVECFVELFTVAEEALRRYLPDGPFQPTNLQQWGV